MSGRHLNEWGEYVTVFYLVKLIPTISLDPPLFSHSHIRPQQTYWTVIGRLYGNTVLVGSTWPLQVYWSLEDNCDNMPHVHMLLCSNISTYSSHCL